MSKTREYLLVFTLGAVMYGLIEIVWRGYTHWSMVLTGGACFLIIYNIAPLGFSLVSRALMGAAAITVIELAVGVTVNMIFKLDVWDYSDRPFNLLGQICPLYSVYWFLLCLAGMPLCLRLRQKYMRLTFQSNTAISHMQ
ncbi:MAG: hypothetical protein IJ391_02645 [Clostridia bacterium]|nr:hypothetical protein [Clostridia bacterium]